MIRLQAEQDRPQSAAIDEMKVHQCPFVVAVDSREQLPWTFQGIIISGRRWIIPTKTATLATGDYSIAGHESRLSIERKSVDDLLGSIAAGNRRFRAEHERMADIVKFGQPSGGFACIVIEGCLSTVCDMLDDPLSPRRIGSEVVLGITASWPMRYQVPWFWSGDRRRAELLTFRIMAKFWEEFNQ